MAGEGGEKMNAHRRLLAGALAMLALALAAAGAREVIAEPPGREMPQFVLPVLGEGSAAFSPQGLRGQVWVLNVWASWCTACREEHPRLLELARGAGVPLVGLNHRDGAREASAWLRQLGDPYRETALDAAGRVGRDLGVRGVPETLVIDRDGIVRLRHSGALTRAALERKVLPAVRRWQPHPRGSRDGPP
jgi:cytochrome c biogenesis protein CcmG/thiol:disulfide interchange protein DsbE